jgi:hypothetical protein
MLLNLIKSIQFERKAPNAVLFLLFQNKTQISLGVGDDVDGREMYPS